MFVFVFVCVCVCVCVREREREEPMREERMREIRNMRTETNVNHGSCYVAVKIRCQCHNCRLIDVTVNMIVDTFVFRTCCIAS